jgi:hypothetical protein
VGVLVGVLVYVEVESGSIVGVAVRVVEGV